ncbi:MAG: matrixin family metalloprotease [Pirellulales bacterium]|nr:matrixin family metalloprotease [Pirellulales bacterium]
MGRRSLPLGILLVLLAGGSPASAYHLFGPYPWGEDQTYYLKWGDIFRPGAPGGTVTWSLMPDGTTIDPAFTDGNVSGTSQLNGVLNSLGYNGAIAAIERAFESWSSVANIYFRQVADSGLPFHNADANPPNTGHIRIGAFAINGNVGAVGYAPPPNGGPLEGDILFNVNSLFQFAAGQEGEEIDFYVGNGQFHNDFEGLFLHELGHALGLDHSDVCSVMSVDFECYKYLNRHPDADDIAALQFLYGPALQADFNENNLVDGGDLPAWISGFGMASEVSHAGGDANRDGAAEGGDFLIWQREFGQGEADSASWAVPEPRQSDLVLLGLAIAGRKTGGVVRRRRAVRHGGMPAGWRVRSAQ